jgi:exopolyphosphatase/guanosine-5'-triphosphate,3'-diphosphate pyrophosphatase
MGVAPLLTVATAAVRDAEDGPDFPRRGAERETGLEIYVIDGDEEARLSAQGVLLGWPGADGLVCDIGGSSMELAEMGGGVVGARHDLGSGAAEADGAQGRQEGHARPYQGDAVRSWRAFPQRARPAVPRGRLMARDRADRHGAARLPAEGAARIPDDAQSDPRHHRDDRKTDVDELRAARPAPAPSGCAGAAGRRGPQGAGAAVQAADIAVSSYGIREGLLYEQMSEALRHRDPLIMRLSRYFLPVLKETPAEAQIVSTG